MEPEPEPEPKPRSTHPPPGGAGSEVVVFLERSRRTRHQLHHPQTFFRINSAFSSFSSPTTTTQLSFVSAQPYFFSVSAFLLLISVKPQVSTGYRSQNNKPWPCKNPNYHIHTPSLTHRSRLSQPTILSNSAHSYRQRNFHQSPEGCPDSPMCRSNCRRRHPTRTSPSHGCNSELSEGNLHSSN
ncbi:hypothetical protein I3760_01G092300 [Carya illinoinensis]|nr:hypothetical protein I3760_01G092300 [Carya illinoinensis]